MKLPALSCLLTIAAIQASDAMIVYAIDINSSSNPTATQTDFEALVVASGTGVGDLTTGGVTFTVVDATGSNDRGNPNPLTQDSAFPDTAAGATMGVEFGTGAGANRLAAGDWKLEVWSHDDRPTTPVGDIILGITINGVQQTADEVNGTSGPDAVNAAATIFFTSDGVSDYGMYVEEDNSNNRVRLNGFRLTQIPEPSIALLSGLGMFGLLRRRR